MARRRMIVLFGGSGVLGTAVAAALAADDVEFVAPARAAVDIRDIAGVWRALAEADATGVINCAGIVPDRNTSSAEMVGVNAVGPHVLADAARQRGAWMIHVSTDCVFGDLQGGPHDAETAKPAPSSLYGRAKFAGEPSSAVVVRTSFIAPEQGLWREVRRAAEGARIPAWTRALWSGSTVTDVAAGIAGLVWNTPDPGVYHLATAIPISKADVVEVLWRRYSQIIPLYDDTIVRPGRALWPSPGPRFTLRPLADAL